MRSRSWWSLLTVFAVLTLLPHVAYAAEPVTLSFASQNPETALSHTLAIQGWARQVEEKTKGAVKIQLFPSQTLCKGKDTWAAVSSGIADMAWAPQGYWPGLTPLTEVIMLPALPFKTAEKGSEVLWKLYETFPEIQKEFAEVKVLCLFSSGPYNLITPKKPIRAMEDLKGMKVRTFGRLPSDQVTLLGGVPMSTPMPETYLALRSGIVDAMSAPWEAILGFRLYEVVSHYTEAPLAPLWFSVIMNNQKWQSLSKENQQAILSVSGLEGSKFWGRNFFDSARAEVAAKAKEGGVKLDIIELSPAERQRWIDISGKPMWDSWVAEMQGKGFTTAKAILEKTIELSKSP